MIGVDLESKLPYNTYNTTRGFGYAILKYLMVNNEQIWKLLKYDTPDALSKPNLTMEEKRKLIWNGTGDAETSQISQLRIYNSVFSPDNRSVGTIDIGIECLCHNKIVNLDNYESRPEVMIQQVIECLNGQDIAGVGVLAFDKDMSVYDVCRMNVYNNRNFFGYSLWISAKVGDINV